MKAVFVCVKGDGVISQAERDFFFGYLDAVGIPESFHEFVRTYQGDDSLKDLLSESSGVSDVTKRVILYTAVIVSAADGYAEGEHAAIVKAAEALGLTEADVHEIEEQWKRDEANKQQRLKTLFPLGNPWASQAGFLLSKYNLKN